MNEKFHEHDLLGIFEALKRSFILYLDTAFSLRNEGLKAERRDILENTNCFWQDPYMELIPDYKSSGKKLSDIKSIFTQKGYSQKEAEEVVDILSDSLLPTEAVLHEHQVEMLEQYLEEKNTLITSGTGSGKTEAFLIPLISYLIKDSSNWSKPNPLPDHYQDWWKNNDWKESNSSLKQSWRVSSREHETRKAAVKGLVLYPMNALVEDQISRLRRVLDSDKTRSWYQKERDGNKIYFGRYTSVTPTSNYEFKPSTGNRKTKKIEELTQHLKNLDSTHSDIDQDSGLDDESKLEARYLFERPSGAEMVSRWDMQSHPPDILITNFSMLGTMLMRGIENNIFEQTRAWLEEPDSVFHLVIDELHLYRGTSGTEVAYLIRLLLDRLGLKPDSPKLRILASSASLEGNMQENPYLKDFFGATLDSFVNVEGDRVSKEASSSTLDINLYLEIGSLLSKTSKEEISLKLDELSKEQGKDNFKELLNSIFKKDRDWYISNLEQYFIEPVSSDSSDKEPQNTLFAKSVFKIAKKIFSGVSEEDSFLAMRGLLFILSLSTDQKLPRFKFHYFFRNFEGLWGCTKRGVFRDLEKLEKFSAENRTTGQLFTDNDLPLNCESHKILEMLYCDVCGDTFYGGFKSKGRQKRDSLLSNDPDLESIPQSSSERFWEKRTIDKYALFWPTEGQLNDEVSRFRLKRHISSDQGPWASWEQRYLDTRTGELHIENEEDSKDFEKGYCIILEDPDYDLRENKTRVLPPICPSCAANFSRRKYRKSPIRSFRTGFSKVSQHYSKELFSRLPEENRKLVLFSDSREDAASISNGIDKTHFSELVRSIIYRHILDLPKLATTTEEMLLNTYPKFIEKLDEKKETLKSLQLIPEENRSNQVKEDIDKLRNEIDSFSSNKKELSMGIILEESALSKNGSLLEELLKVAVNPGGSLIEYQEFNDSGVERRWTDIFNFSKGELKDSLSTAEKAFFEHLFEMLSFSVVNTVLDRSYFSIEAGGIGFAIFPLKDTDFNSFESLGLHDKNQIQDMFNSCLRILGDLFQY